MGFESLQAEDTIHFPDATIIEPISIYDNYRFDGSNWIRIEKGLYVKRTKIKKY